MRTALRAGVIAFDFEPHIVTCSSCSLKLFFIVLFETNSDYAGINTYAKLKSRMSHLNDLQSFFSA